ncbi:ABC-type transporter, integral membrane subunit [Desulfotomaculum nigrificans CO-1-SRB]|uniref:ABC-type transporter, integral membrane subunit n=1 Tax=Desulfotomaculum nigrificans (strain DSM 14880 / VKM B-2319 / CO-1-SRB) TaxID=868595 RepID=F6B862_DESCC|nr:ABC transporter permease [Desulfotomaculum nigrificans]AEF93507.1 ABC-type transporter, integral membrane subunit [Desulfotomaculum nigrificans CO-1-SRB]
MRSFILKRLGLGVLVLLGVITVTFFITRVIPSDPAAQWVGPRATPQQIAAARVELGLDQPLYVQYGKYISQLVHGDLGKSLRSHQPVADELKSYLPATIELVVLSTIIALFLGIPLGVISAKRKDQLVDHFSRIFSVGAVSLPTFWVGLFLQLLFYRILGVLPLGDQLSTDVKLLYEIPHITGFLLFDSLVTGNLVVFKDALVHMILPGITIALYPLGLVARMTRSALLEILNEDYISAARSYGLPERLVLWKYALKNSLGPTATVVTLSIGYTLVNTFLIEAIFSWPGIGSYISAAVISLDYPAIMGVTIFSAIAYVILNMIADFIIALDPRVRA